VDSPTRRGSPKKQKGSQINSRKSQVEKRTFAKNRNLKNIPGYLQTTNRQIRKPGASLAGTRIDEVNAMGIATK